MNLLAAGTLNENLGNIVTKLNELMDSFWLYIVLALAAVVVVWGAYVGTMPNGIRKKAHRKDEAIRSYAAALRLFRNVRRKNDKRGRTDTKRIKVYVGFVFDTQTL